MYWFSTTRCKYPFRCYCCAKTSLVTVSQSLCYYSFVQFLEFGGMKQCLYLSKRSIQSFRISSFSSYFGEVLRLSLNKLRMTFKKVGPPISPRYTQFPNGLCLPSFYVQQHWHNPDSLEIPFQPKLDMRSLFRPLQLYLKPLESNISSSTFTSNMIWQCALGNTIQKSCLS